MALTHFEFSFTIDTGRIAWSKYAGVSFDAAKANLFKDDGGITVVVPFDGAPMLDAMDEALATAKSFLTDELTVATEIPEPWRITAVSQELLEQHFIANPTARAA